MADILAYLQAINSAVYGNEVRSSIHDAISKMNTELESSIDTLDTKYSQIETENSTIVETAQTLINSVGKPLQAAYRSEMTDTNYIYVYTGSESGMQTGNWYYYNDGEWVSGGQYNASVMANLVLGTGLRSVVENDVANNLAAGDYAHAEGKTTSASGEASHAEGNGTSAEGNASHAEGIGTVAVGEGQHVFGQYNVEADDDYIEIVGNGNNDEARSNARLLDKSGNEWIAGRLELGPEHTYLDNVKVQRYDIISDYLNSISEVQTVTGSSDHVAISNAANGMSLRSINVEFYPVLNTETDTFELFDSLSINMVGDHTDTYNVVFTDSVGSFYGGIYEPISGRLTVTMVGNSSTWGEMDFSINPNDYIGKRMPLSDCLAGTDGNSQNTLCNVSSTYLYDQSATTHHYIYKDSQEDTYAVVVLPDDTDDSTIITVIGTLEKPVVYDIDPLKIVCNGGTNTVYVDKGTIEEVQFYKDLVAPNIEELRELIDTSSGIQTGYTVEEKAKLQTIAQGAEVNVPAFGVIRIGEVNVSATADQDIVQFVAGDNVTIEKSNSGKAIIFSASLGDDAGGITDAEIDEICV